MTGRLLNLSQVPNGDRAAVWQRLQRERPEIAALVGSEWVQDLRSAFDAEVIVEDFT